MAAATRSTHTQSARPAPRKHKRYKKRTPKWTKWPRFPGQATFNLADDMTQIPFAKPSYKSPEVTVIEEEASAGVLQCTVCGVMTQACLCDPLMKELNELEKDGRRRDFPAISLSMPANQTSGLIPDRIPPTLASPRFPSFDQPPVKRSALIPPDRHPPTFASPQLFPEFIPSTAQDSTILLQPETRPITQEQLVNEVKGIYAGLIMVEMKCIEIDIQQASTKNKLSNEQWQALIALHRTLLDRHHDFYLATHHPSASPALRDLARKYEMPSRMWEHGINGFLKSVRHQMPGMARQMLAYLNFAYSILEKLSVQVPSLAPEWVECMKGLDTYCRELQRIPQPGPSSTPPLFNLNYMEHQCRASASPNIDGMGPISYPDVDLDALDGFDDLPSNLEPTSTSSISANADQEADAASRQEMPDASMPQLPWDVALSQVASLALAGWLWVGQGSSLDFNIFVKVFCILAMSDLVWSCCGGSLRSCRRSLLADASSRWMWENMWANS